MGPLGWYGMQPGSAQRHLQNHILLDFDSEGLEEVPGDEYIYN